VSWASCRIAEKGSDRAVNSGRPRHERRDARGAYIDLEASPSRRSADEPPSLESREPSVVREGERADCLTEIAATGRVSSRDLGARLDEPFRDKPWSGSSIGVDSHKGSRNLSMDGELEGVEFLIRDRDSKYTRSFDEVFGCEGSRVIKTPVRAPKANAFAERFVRTVRHEVLDHTLVLGRRHLDRILRRYAEHYNAQRPHRGLDLRTPAGDLERPISPDVPRVRRIDVLGGLIHEYEPVAA
jgi:hypothetical protein